jgi:hypothetical protein
MEEKSKGDNLIDAELLTAVRCVYLCIAQPYLLLRSHKREILMKRHEKTQS